MSGSEASIRKGMERTRLRQPSRSQYKGTRPVDPALLAPAAKSTPPEREHPIPADHPIIGIPRQLISSQSHLPIKRRQKDVAEQGRNYSTLGSPALGRKEPPFAVASGLEHRFDEAKHSSIRYALGDQREELLVIHGPEKVSEVRIHDPLRPALNLFPHFAQRILRRSPSPISEAGIIK